MLSLQELIDRYKTEQNGGRDPQHWLAGCRVRRSDAIQDGDQQRQRQLSLANSALKAGARIRAIRLKTAGRAGMPTSSAESRKLQRGSSRCLLWTYRWVAGLPLDRLTSTAAMYHRLWAWPGAPDVLATSRPVRQQSAFVTTAFLLALDRPLSTSSRPDSKFRPFYTAHGSLNRTGPQAVAPRLLHPAAVFHSRRLEKPAVEFLAPAVLDSETRARDRSPRS
jgi:hypothetical protein